MVCISPWKPEWHCRTPLTFEESPAAQKFPLRSIGQSGSDESIAFIQRMLVECDAKHPRCKLGLTGEVIEEETQMPSRVIDIVSFDDHGTPRLLETKGPKGRYIAVSHSWGKIVKPFTTTKNVESLKKRIDFASLPKTFQDSIFIARKLGVQYVWIDSVCIIQDDGEDWTHEAKTMGLVYQKAYLTISASQSPGDHARFLTQNGGDDGCYVAILSRRYPLDTYICAGTQAASSHDAQL